MSDKAPKEKIQVEPTPSDPDLVAWYESIFDGADQFPETVEVRIVTGRNGERLGPMVKQFQFKPEDKSKKKEIVESGGASERIYGRPSREEIVKTTNEILFLCQRDCNQSNRPVKYAVLVKHFARNDDYYMRWLMTLQPKTNGAKVSSNADDDDDDSEEGSTSRKFSVHILHHHERMSNMQAATVEGLIDRMDRTLDREYKTNELLRATMERQADMIERLQSNRHEREMALDWNRLKMKTVEKGMELAVNMAPTVLQQLTGKKSVQTVKSAESITLETFFKSEAEGGKMTVAQSDAAFGHYEEGKSVTPGVLTEAQTTILYEISTCVRTPDDLDALLPGGQHEVTMGQVMALQKIFADSIEQIAPIMLMIQNRMANKQK